MNFDDILDEEISNLSIDYKLISIDEKDNSKLYFVHGDDNIFLPTNTKGAVLFTDGNDIVYRIRIDFEELMDENLFLEITKQYGTPRKMLCKDKLLHKDSGSANGIDFSENNYSLKECAFDQRPVVMIWKKDGLQLKFVLSYEAGEMHGTVTKE